MGHFVDVLPRQSLGIVLKKLNLTQQKQNTQTITQNKPKKLNLTRTDCNIQYNHRLECGPMPNVMAAVAPSVQCCKVWLTPTTTVPCGNAAKT